MACENSLIEGDDVNRFICVFAFRRHFVLVGVTFWKVVVLEVGHLSLAVPF